MQTPNPYEAPLSPSYAPSGPLVKMSLRDTLFGFQGRIPRRIYWLWSLLPGIIFVVVIGLLAPLFSTPPPPDAPPGTESGLSPVGMIVMLLLYIPLVWISLAVSAKRWHDRAKSGWWILISLIPIVGGIWMFVECGCLRGTEGPNQFGADPT
jgi:uncharacterized membrane protein YhaH (DUF805 family)